MAAADMNTTPQWKVLGVNPNVDVATGGLPVRGNTVTYVTALGHRGTVFVPDNTPVPDGARDIVAAAAARTDAIATLTG
jgi:hypothetical protein